MTSYDVAFIGNYTKDTISDSTGERVVDGGAFNYGANVARRLGYRTCAITRLSKEDNHVVKKLEELGVDVFPEFSSASTHLRLVYPGENPDEREIHVDSTAGSFSPEQVATLDAQIAVIGASFRGEVGLDVLQTLTRHDIRIALDVQGFVRSVRNGRLVVNPWPEKEEVLRMVRILKADAIEAEILTGNKELRNAAEILHKTGPAEIVLTHREGVLVYDGDRIYEARFYPRMLVGRSGRGDTCIAAYSCCRLEMDPPHSTIWAAAVTSLKMESNAPFSADRKDVERLIRERYA